MDSDLAMDLPEGSTGRNPLVKLREVSLYWFKLLRNMPKRIKDLWWTQKLRSDNFAAGDHVILTYPNHPPNKLMQLIVTTWLRFKISSPSRNLW